MIDQKFQEVPEEFEKDLSLALPEIPTDTIKNWKQLTLRTRVEILRLLTPDERFMYTLREACLEHDGGPLSVFGTIRTCHINGGAATEYILNAAGWIDSSLPQSSIATVPKGNDQRFLDNMYLLHQRVSGCTEKSVQRGIEFTKKFQAAAPEISTPCKMNLDLQRCIFNVRLSQELVLNVGITERFLRNVLGQTNSGAFNALHRVQFSRLLKVDTINDYLRLLPIEIGQKLAREYLTIRAEPACFFKKLTLENLRDEIEHKTSESEVRMHTLDSQGKYGHRNTRASLDMYWRALGYEDPASLTEADLMEITSKTIELHRMLGIAKADPNQVAKDALEATIAGLYRCSISTAKTPY